MDGHVPQYRDQRFRLHWDDPRVVSALAGSIAGALTATFVCPLDVLKTRLQVQSRQAVRIGITGSLTKIFQEEGIRGLYRGLTPTLAALLPNWCVYFSVYDRLKTNLASRAQGHDWIKPPAIHMASATIAGVATMCVTNPLWVVKTRLQTQHMGIRMGRTTGDLAPLYTGTANALTRIYREEGLHGLYSGLLPSLLGVAHVAIQFPLYEAIKSYFADGDQKKIDRLPMTQLMAASALSKVVASTATYPHEVIRSHMHVLGLASFSGFTSTVSQIFQEDGMRGFYRGCTTNLVRTTPAAALTFTSFELIARRMRALGEEQRQKEREEWDLNQKK